ncbi:MAG: DNA cytosine methyltransferase [Chitinophagaceae bacterium]|nr:DNA cytosine methyltransferase [Chitinophagaceae bacterium]
MRIQRDESLGVTLFEPDDFDNPIIQHYAFTRCKSYKASALKEMKRVYEQKELEEPFTQAFAESALDQWLFDVLQDVPFPGPRRGEEDFTFIDLFAGIGGFRIAMQELNGLCVFSSEWDLAAQETYRRNFGERPFGDITKQEVKRHIPKEFDILCAGFPCQPFSRAGVSARNFLGKEHGFEDKIQGNLFFDIIEIVEKHRPKVLFLENVKNLKSHDGGNTLATIKSMIENLGYSFNFKVINSQTLVPQRRERSFIVCFRNRSKTFEFPDFSGEPLKLSTILEQSVPDSFTISDALWDGHIRRSKRNKERGTGFTVGLADLNKPSNTIVARYYKDGKECLIPQDGKNPRMLTPKECSRLQGFPDSFQIHKSKKQAYHQFGNSVAVPVIKKIAKEILKKI